MRAALREPQRTYKACSSCRDRKVRCNLDLDGRPPCARCRRQQKECLFGDTQRRGRTSRGSHRADRGSLARPLEFSASHDHTDGPSRHQTVQQQSGILPSSTSHVHYAHETLPVNAGHLQQDSPSSSGVAESVLRTVVSTGNDALNILFEAASRDRNTILDSPCSPVNGVIPQQSRASQPNPINIHGIPSQNLDVLRVWDTCRFVTMGWLTAKDAVMYMDLFFRDMSQLSPILTNYYASHDHHHELITHEPMLSCTILLISSRYHVLPGMAGLSKAYFLHNRLWKYWQNLMMRVMFGQEKHSKTSMRAVGTIESLILMSEWHPRSINFPPEGYGWDSDLTVSCPHHTNNPKDDNTPSDMWLEEVVEPVRRSDQMSWMLLGSALSLAQKLGIFDSQDGWNNHPPCNEEPGKISMLLRRGVRVQGLLHVYIDQLASRLGCTSLIPQSLTFAVADQTGAAPVDSECQWDAFICAWMGLTKLLNSTSHAFFLAASSTRYHLQNGRYIRLLRHFKPLLEQWREKHLDKHCLSDALQDILFVEYQYVRIFMNSLGIQGVVERALVDSNLGIALEYGQPIDMGDMDYEFIQEVISGSCQILEKVTDMAESGALRFAPFRFYIRVTSSSVFLLKALGLGVRNTELQASLNILERSIQALKSCTLDDMHLAPRYATLLEVHVTRLRRHFIVSSGHPHISRWMTRQSSPQQTSAPLADDIEGMTGQEASGSNIWVNSPLHGVSDDDWLSLPFDPSMAPFGLASSQSFPRFEEGALDFVWNLPP